MDKILCRPCTLWYSVSRMALKTPFFSAPARRNDLWKCMASPLHFDRGRVFCDSTKVSYKNWWNRGTLV